MNHPRIWLEAIENKKTGYFSLVLICIGSGCCYLLQFKNAAELRARTKTVQKASVHFQREVLQFDTVTLSKAYTTRHLHQHRLDAVHMHFILFLFTPETSIVSCCILDLSL